MAKIGLKNIKYSVLDEKDEVTTAKSFGKAVSCKVSIETNSAELYADDAIAESDNSFNKGTITLGIDEDDDTVFAEILGHTISELGEVVRKANDIAPYVAIGRILTKVVNGVRKYKVEFLSKVKFKEPSQEDKTKGESIEFSTPEVEGTILTLADETWSKAQTFNTYTEAETYLNGLLTKTA